VPSLHCYEILMQLYATYYNICLAGCEPILLWIGRYWNIYLEFLPFEVINHNFQVRPTTSFNITWQSIPFHIYRLVETTFEDLEDSGCIKVDDHSVQSLILGKIASQYYLSYLTVSMFGSNIGPNTSLEVSKIASLFVWKFFSLCL
jgi:hypothetical protein